MGGKKGERETIEREKEYVFLISFAPIMGALPPSLLSLLTWELCEYVWGEFLRSSATGSGVLGEGPWNEETSQ